MYLTVQAHTDEEFRIDLDDLYRHNSAHSESCLYGLLVGKLAKWAASQGARLSEIIPISVTDGMAWDDRAPLVTITGSDWIREVAQLTWFIPTQRRTDSDQVFACIDGRGWRAIDFDRLEDEVATEHYSEFHGPYERFARSYAYDHDERVSDTLEKHVNWESYGEELMRKFTQFRWNGRTFLYYQ